MADEKSKQLNETLSQIEKQFGKGTVMRMGDREVADIPAISTGSIGLDIALGIGGVPQGRVIEIFGPESSGKTTLTLQVIAKSKSVDLLVIDSVAALTPRAEIEGEMGDHHVGLQARLMSQALRKITGNIQRSNATVIFINQIRMKIGVMFGNPETTSGGNALKFYSSVRLDIRRIGAVKEGEEVIGNETRVKVVKNKVSPPFTKAEFQILYGKGINVEGEIIDFGQKLGLIEKAGSWYSYNDEKIGQGKTNASNFLRENKKIRNALVKQIKAAHIKSKSKKK